MTLIVALAIGVGIFAAGIWTVRLLARPVPPEPDPEELEPVAIDFACTICGMQLTVTAAQGDEVKAPRHCREEMEFACRFEC